MNYTVRTMTMSEHTRESWDDLFGIDDSERKNYCIIYVPTGKAIDWHLTLGEAKDQAEYLQDLDDQDDAEYWLDHQEG